MIRLVVKFAMHFCDELVDGHKLRSAVAEKSPEPSSPHFIACKVARDDAAKKISEVAMASMLKIEEHVKE